ncbi:hypothetical protein PV325_007473, partial [Microctonus aethiopoides]
MVVKKERVSLKEILEAEIATGRNPEVSGRDGGAQGVGPFPRKPFSSWEQRNVDHSTAESLLPNSLDILIHVVVIVVRTEAMIYMHIIYLYIQQHIKDSAVNDKSKPRLKRTSPTGNY